VTELRKRFELIQPHKNLTKILHQHDNARPHTSLKTQEAITKFGCTVLPHSPYSPRLASSDSQPLGDLKDAIRGTIFDTDGNVIHAVTIWLCEQDKTWYQQGIHILVPRWCKTTEVEGDFVEKYAVAIK
jgi:hypothetical protein